jgi:hypothetical protein
MVTDPGVSTTSPPWYAGAVEALELIDYRRRVASLYAMARHEAVEDPEAAWLRWRTARDELLASHPQSPVPPAARASFTGMAFHPYDHRWRVEVQVDPLPPATGSGTIPLAHSGAGASEWRAVGQVSPGGPWGGVPLTLLWLTTYGGGLFLPFRDATSGATTYGGGRYLLDTVKGADLGGSPDGVRLVLDANFAYHPSCAHDPRWSCPLAPPSNRLTASVEAGELSPPATPG